jgi:transcriptional regulator with XRE-family HTH domain
MKNISRKIKDLRVKKGYTLEELGDKINFNYSNLSKIERGIRPPTLELIEKLSEFYNVPLSYFFGEENPIPEELKKLGAEWVTVVEELKEKEITPEEIKAIIEILDRRKK